jgi:aspartate/methionine/tyrosine aminotransferase
MNTSAEAMQAYIAQAEDLHEPAMQVSNPNLPTLPDLKALAQQRRAEGEEVIDQSAGDIDALNQPLSPDFLAYVEEYRNTAKDEKGNPLFPRAEGEVGEWPANYQRAYPEAIKLLGRSWGIEKTPFLGIQTVSGRNALDLMFRGLLARAKTKKGSDKEPALILDPFAWSGYGPLARDLGIKLINTPATEGLTQSPEALIEALEYARQQGLNPVGTVLVTPSNPTGLGMPKENLKALAEAAAEADIPLLVDAFYSPLDPKGHDEAVNLAYLENVLPPEVLKYISMLVGETKVTSSQKKTGTLINLAPEGHDEIAKILYKIALKRISTTNAYPRPDEVATAMALHTYPGGIHDAMGPRWTALEETRKAIRELCDDLGLPLSIGESFYALIALVDPEGNGLVRDEEGAPVDDPKEIIDTLIRRFGLVGAPGLMFRSTESAKNMARLTATASPDEVAALRGVLEQMLQEAQQHG